MGTLFLFAACAIVVLVALISQLRDKKIEFFFVCAVVAAIAIHFIDSTLWTIVSWLAYYFAIVWLRQEDEEKQETKYGFMTGHLLFYIHVIYGSFSLMETIFS